MHGPLSEIGLVEVLQLLERGKRSGLLRVVGPDPSMPKTIHIRDGRVVAFEPDADDAALSAALAARHLVSSDGESDEDGQSGLPDAVIEALRRELAVRCLATMLHWSRGRFDFQEQVVKSGPLSLAADSLVLDVVDAESRRVELAPLTSDFHAVPEFAQPDLLAAGPQLSLVALDWRILDAVDGVRDVGGVAAVVGEPLEDVAERILAMVSATILVLQARPADVSHEARAAIEAGRYEEAAVLLRGKVLAEPGDGEAWHTLGLAEVGAGRFDRAIEAWEAWSTSEPDRADEAASLMRAARTMLEALHETRD